MSTKNSASSSTPSKGRDVSAPTPRTTSRELLGSANELIIEHGEREYRLRLTASGKLILTA